MRSLLRLAKPQILVQREALWLDRFLATPLGTRPPSYKYRHQEILSRLLDTSYQKCFYCECLLKGVASEVDHHIEVAIDRSLAFTWDNLYLACTNCNDKLNHNEIPITNALDPCINTDAEINEHLRFEDDVILPRGNSIMGSNTIKKYKLGTITSEYLRMKELRKLSRILEKVLLECNHDHREPTEEELESIKSFTYREKAYSLMFKQKLDGLGF
ncbi:HNH endonuclease [Pedobacter sp. MC2016-15]|uniref:HNH endonuclease n=1 Tax=Pedobacter sp. MC2016-15 TaxID=2994473 RepID=UPI002246505E|nr:HNH endonuclease [Pedobacter sp. MC2016-15]MCX2481049.1 HNH endonuclease [Pedobacter sp. MC2016-15]